jgi:hypothetical protein
VRFEYFRKTDAVRTYVRYETVNTSSINCIIQIHSKRQQRNKGKGLPVTCYEDSQEGSDMALLILNLGAKWEWWTTPRSGRFGPGKGPTHWRRNQGRSGCVQRKANFLPPQGFKPTTVQPVESRYTHLATPIASKVTRYKPYVGMVRQIGPQRLIRNCTLNNPSTVHIKVLKISSLNNPWTKAHLKASFYNFVTRDKSSISVRFGVYKLPIANQLSRGTADSCRCVRHIQVQYCSHHSLQQPTAHINHNYPVTWPCAIYAINKPSLNMSGTEKGNRHAGMSAVTTEWKSRWTGQRPDKLTGQKSEKLIK